jgi:hypothetical protein
VLGGNHNAALSALVPDFSGHAPLLAEGDAALDPAAGRGNLEPTVGGAGAAMRRLRVNLSGMLSTGLTLVLATIAAAIAAPAFADDGRIDPFSLKLRAPAKSLERFGDLPLGAVIRIDDRYGSDRLFQGPRGWDYWNRLENPRPSQGIQNAAHTVVDNFLNVYAGCGFDTACNYVP